MFTLINSQSLFNSILYSSVGIFMLCFGFYVFDKITPIKLWEEIVDEQNIALAIIAGAMALGISNIIASAIT